VHLEPSADRFDAVAQALQARPGRDTAPPTPSSVISTRRPPFSRAVRTAALVAPAYRTTFVSASETTS
jgi:hypothetical protein